MIPILLAYGADKLIKNKYGETPVVIQGRSIKKTATLIIFNVCTLLQQFIKLNVVFM